MRAKCWAATAGSLRNRSAIQPAVNSCFRPDSFPCSAARRRARPCRRRWPALRSSSLRASSRRSTHHSSGSSIAAASLRRRQHQFGGLGDLVGAAQQLNAGEQDAGVAVARSPAAPRSATCALLALLVDRGPRLGDGRLVAAEAMGGAQARSRCRWHRAGAPCGPCRPRG